MNAPTLRHRAATICEEAKVERPAIQMGQSGCKHYWEIDSATAQVSKGICKLCGAHKQFPNYLSDCIAGSDKETYQGWLGVNPWNWTLGVRKVWQGQGILVREERGPCHEESEDFQSGVQAPAG